MSPSSASDTIVTAILAGGQAKRLGGAIKATLPMAGHPLLTRVLATLAPQSAASVLCVAARHVGASWVKAAGMPVAVDAVEDCGPLAGISAALQWARTTMPDAQGLVTVPVDVPFAPHDLVARLRGSAPEGGIAVAQSGDRTHHAIAYWPLSLTDALAADVGKADAVHRWQSRYPIATVSWPVEPYDPFFNINTAADLQQAAQIATLADDMAIRHRA